MKLTLDTANGTLALHDGDSTATMELYSRESFEVISRIWVKVAWNEKYPYTFSWLGRPLIQFPEDVLRIQETIYRVKPSLIVETGVAHGGSLVLYASLLRAFREHGRVIGVDADIRPHNRAAIEAHELSSSIGLVVGSSIDQQTVQAVYQQVRRDDRVLVVLDSNHTRAHVAAELEAYAPLVSPGSYIVATDGGMEDLWDVPRGQPSWRADNPAAAAREFAERHPEFQLEDPPAFPFNESRLRSCVGQWPAAYLRRL